jgi:hypothetical protein
MVEDFLKGIKVSSIRPERVTTPGGTDPVIHARNRLIDSINLHKQLVQAEIEGKDLDLTITKRTKTGETVTVPKRIVKWYFKTRDGNWHTVIRYGTQSLKFEGGDALQVGPELSDLVKIYDRIVKAVGDGKLDQHIEIAKQRAPRGSRQAEDAANDETDEGLEEEFEPPAPAGRTSKPTSATEF